MLEINYHTAKCFLENLLAIEMKRKKRKATRNKPIFRYINIRHQ